LAKLANQYGSQPATGLGALPRQPVSLGSVRVRLAVRIGQVSVRRQRCTLGNRPRCGCGCGSHRLNVGRQRVGLGSAADAVRFASGLAAVRIGNVPRYLGQVSVRMRGCGNRSRCVRWQPVIGQVAIGADAVHVGQSARKRP
jgi:hypothetical protein